MFRSCVTLLALAAVLSGCATGFVYNRLDWVVSWYVGGFVTLDDAQERQLRSLVASTLDWHRRTQLPRYVQFLDDLDRDTEAPMSAGRIQERYDEMTEAYDALLNQVTPQSAALLRTLRPAQLRELFENIEDDNRELSREYSGKTPEARLDRRTRSAIRALQRFTGNLNQAQKALIVSQLAGMHDLAPDWIEHRRAWQAHFRSLLEGPLQDGDFESALRDLMVHPNQFDQPGYRRKADENRQRTFELLAALSETLTTAQRNKFGDKLQEYSHLLTEIAAQK